MYNDFERLLITPICSKGRVKAAESWRLRDHSSWRIVSGIGSGGSLVWADERVGAEHTRVMCSTAFPYRIWTLSRNLAQPHEARSETANCAWPEYLLAPAHIYCTAASNSVSWGSISYMEALISYEAVKIASSEGLLSGCADMGPRLGRSTSATGNYKLHRRTGFDKWARSRRELGGLRQVVGRSIAFNSKRQGGGSAHA